MSKTFNFEFKQSYKEVTIAGEVFQVKFDDESIMKYQMAFQDHMKKISEAQGMITDYEKATPDELVAMNAKQIELTQSTLELFLGEGTFEGLYEKAGRSSMNMIDLINMLMQMVEEELKERAGEAGEQYLTNLKK